MHGAATSLTVGIFVTLIVFTLGVALRRVRGLLRRMGSTGLLSRIGDIFFAIPYILAAVVIMSVFAEYRERVAHLPGDRRLRVAGRRRAS